MFKLKRRLIGILAHHTGKSEEQIQTDSDRDYWMTAQQAKEYRLVDEVCEIAKRRNAGGLAGNRR
jgi:ATP-dependent Clp protease protease subunit